VEDIKNLLNRTKISSGSLSALNNTFTSNESGGNDFPVALWENPFLHDQEDDVMEQSNREMSTYSSSSHGLFSVFDENRGHKKQIVLEDLPYRTLDIDVVTASVIKIANIAEGTLELTEDGVIIDNWNCRGDATFNTYRIREGLRKAYHVKDTEMSSSTADGDSNMLVDIQKPRKRIFIVCYHLPVIVSKDADTGKWMACWAESILAKTADSAFVSAYDPHWVGTCTTSSPIEDEADKQSLRSLLASMNCTVLFFDENVRNAHYKGFCKQVLWMAFHHVDLLDARDPAFGMDFNATSTEKYTDGSLLDLKSPWDQRQISKWWEAFSHVNHAFSVEMARMVQPDDIVWVHDYHLSLLPRMLSEQEKKIGSRLTRKIFYLHIPFPVSMIFKEMEFGTNILEGILHADTVGFHSFTDARHFLSSAKRILGLPHDSLEGGLIGVKYKGRVVVVTMSSVSVEPEMVEGKNHPRAILHLSLSG
jgi:trehalose 6-phosphate synthase/phosphatase